MEQDDAFPVVPVCGRVNVFIPVLPRPGDNLFNRVLGDSLPSMLWVGSVPKRERIRVYFRDGNEGDNLTSLNDDVVFSLFIKVDYWIELKTERREVVRFFQDEVIEIYDAIEVVWRCQSEIVSSNTLHRFV